MRQLATPDMRQFPGRLSWQDFTSIHPSNTPMVLGVVLFSSSILTTIQLRVHDYVHFYHRGSHPEDKEGPPMPSFKLQFLTINFISFYTWNRKIWVSWEPSHCVGFFRKDDKKEMWLIFSEVGDYLLPELGLFPCLLNHCG